MAKVISDFADLRELKRRLKADESAGEDFSAAQKRARQEQRPRSRVVINRTKAEIQAAADGIAKGMAVRMMDTNDRGVVTGFGDGWYEIESDGLRFRAQRCEFVVTDADEDRKLMNAVPARKKICGERLEKETAASEISIDLHLERIPGSSGIPAWAALDFQMDYFRMSLRKNLKYKGRRLTFIHGVGDGVLAGAIRRELDGAFAMSCTYTYGELGKTIVTVR